MSPRGWNSLSVTWWYFHFLSHSFPLRALQESPLVEEAWSITVIPFCCFFSCNSPLGGRRFKEFVLLKISAVLSGGFSVSRTGQPKPPLLLEVGAEPDYININDRARKNSIFVLAQMDISNVIQGRVQKVHLGKTKPRESVKFKLLKFLGLELGNLFLSNIFCYMMLW